MKLHISARRIALVYGSLLVSLGSASAQEPRMPNLAGTYNLKNPAPCTAIRKTIDDTVKGMLPGIKGKARDRLRTANLPPPLTLVIAYTPTDVTIGSDLAGSITTPADGTPVNATRYKDTFQISTRWQNGKLERTFENDEGRRVNAYSIDGAGKLTLQVTVTDSGSRLRQPLTYDLVYARSTAERNDVPDDRYPDCAKEFQRRGRVVVKDATKTAKKEVKDRFHHLQERTLDSHVKGGPLSTGYEPEDIIYAAEAGRATLIAGLDGDQFAVARAFVQAKYPVPTKSRLIGSGSPSGLATKQSKNLSRDTQLGFLNSFTLETIEFDFKITSYPSGATYEVWNNYDTWRGASENTERMYPGVFKCTVRMTGFKPISEPICKIDLRSGKKHLHCILTKEDDVGDVQPCNLLP